MSKAHNRSDWKRLSKARIAVARANSEVCVRCGKPINYALPGNTKWGPTTDHLHPIARGGNLIVPLDQLAPAHNTCNSRHGNRIKHTKQTSGFKKSNQKNPTVLLTSPPGVPHGFGWVAGVPWLAPLVSSFDPRTDRWPSVMSGPHRDAVGSFGWEAVEWLRSGSGLRLRLRWWQQLAMVRQLEHDAAGRLVWPEVVESTRRRAGKSTRIRAVSLWRVHQADRFGEPQLVMFTGKDLPICKEIHRRAWFWAEAQGFTVRKTNGQEEIELPDLSRWMVRGQESVYGYDTTMGEVDEAWAVPARIVDDGLEPSLMDRVSPQLHFTSTAHRRAKKLMRMRLGAGFEQLDDPVDTLVLLWGAGRDAQVDDPVVWREASPWWGGDTLRHVEKVWRRVVAGQSLDDEPDPLEPDPVEAFRAQYLNVWPDFTRRSRSWIDEGLVEGAGRESVVLPGAGLVGAVEVDVDGGWAAAVGDGQAVRVFRGGSLVECVQWLGGFGAGEVFAHQAVAQQFDPVWGVDVRVVSQAEAAAAGRMVLEAVRDGQVVWDRPELVGREFADVVVAPVDGGFRVVASKSRGPVGLVKCVSWVVWAGAVRRVPAPAIW